MKVSWLQLLYFSGTMHAGWMMAGSVLPWLIEHAWRGSTTMAILTGEPGWPDAPGGPGGPGGPWNANLKKKYKINTFEIQFSQASKRCHCIGMIMVSLKMWTITM